MVKAEAIGLKSGEPVTTVAVKMIRSMTDAAALESLVGELKIMIHLGSHVNVVNLMGACTDISKGQSLYSPNNYEKIFNNISEFLMQYHHCRRFPGAGRILPIR